MLTFALAGVMTQENIGSYLAAVLARNKARGEGIRTQAALAIATKKDPSYINKLLKGKYPKPEIETLDVLASELDLPIKELMRVSGYPESAREAITVPEQRFGETVRLEIPPDDLTNIGRQVMEALLGARNLGSQQQVRAIVERLRQIPVLNAITAAQIASEYSQVEEWLDVPASILAGAEKPVAFLVTGDCLALRGVIRGDHLIVDAANTEPHDGQIVAARLNGEDTAKIFHRVDPTTVELRPSLDLYPTFIAQDGRDTLEIIGVFVAVWPTGNRG